ncbi:jacalin-related lectin 19-like [Neltuma alba]|uniref:jacalin-related lectin 19-like n=1 Tax=Neltuma alba TaxID=207710 RepID=UPI0010A50926|nr:jacalin-related lectin 19-like [Prosopis alba]
MGKMRIEMLEINYAIREMKEETGRKKRSLIVGPWGGNGGSSWDDGCFTGVREITLVYGHCIDSIQVVYDKNGEPFMADKHGGNGGNNTVKIKLQYPNEFLIGVSGHYFPFKGALVIRSLTFKSTTTTYGPCGFEQGTPFTFSMEGGKVVGFKGRSGVYLDSVAFEVS